MKMVKEKIFSNASKDFDNEVALMEKILREDNVMLLEEVLSAQIIFLTEKENRVYLPHYHLIFFPKEDSECDKFIRKVNRFFRMFCVESTEEINSRIKEIPSIIKFRNALGRTLLHKAVKRGSLKLLKMFLEQGINPNIQDNEGFAALHWALFHKDPVVRLRMIQHLTSAKNANLNLQDDEGNTALHWALFQSQPVYIIQEFLKAKSLNLTLKNQYGDPILHSAVKQNNIKIVEELVKRHNVDLNLKNIHKQRAIDIAINNGYHEIAKFLEKKMKAELEKKRSWRNKELNKENQENVISSKRYYRVAR